MGMKDSEIIFQDYFRFIPHWESGSSSSLSVRDALCIELSARMENKVSPKIFLKEAITGKAAAQKITGD